VSTKVFGVEEKKIFLLNSCQNKLYEYFRKFEENISSTTPGEKKINYFSPCSCSF
jgi:hypothetical protein